MTVSTCARSLDRLRRGRNDENAADTTTTTASTRTGWTVAALLVILAMMAPITATRAQEDDPAAVPPGLGSSRLDVHVSSYRSFEDCLVVVLRPR